jgi:predicted phage terminase large subunit-like protein
MNAAPSVDYYASLRNYCSSSYFNFLRVFTKTTFGHDFKWNWHIPLLAGEFERQVRRHHAGLPREYDVVTNICPGTTKSTVFSIHSVPWAWTVNPRLRFIGASFSQPLSFELSTAARQVVESPLYQKLWPEIELLDDKNRMSHWGNTLGGGRYACTVGGSVMGMHGDIISIDDPLDPIGGRSKAELKTARIWTAETISQRKTDKKRSITFLTMQRIHRLDPTDVFLTRGTPVKHYSLPGRLGRMVRPRELRQRYVNGLLDPDRLSEEVLGNMKLELGVYGYAGQVMQDPIPDGGGMFDSAKLLLNAKQVPPDSEFVQIVRAWDKAITDGGGKYTCGVKMGMHKNGSIWVLDVRRGQWGPDERNKRMRATTVADGINVRVLMEEEGGSSGKFDALMSLRDLAGYRVRAIRPTGSKELRADTFASQVNGGNVFVPIGAAWLFPYADELAFFPDGEYSDQVDGSSLAYMGLVGTARVGAL